MDWTGYARATGVLFIGIPVLCISFWLQHCPRKYLGFNDLRMCLILCHKSSYTRTIDAFDFDFVASQALGIVVPCSVTSSWTCSSTSSTTSAGSVHSIWGLIGAPEWIILVSSRQSSLWICRKCCFRIMLPLGLCWAKSHSVSWDSIGVWDAPLGQFPLHKIGNLQQSNLCSTAPQPYAISRWMYIVSFEVWNLSIQILWIHLQTGFFGGKCSRNGWWNNDFTSGGAVMIRMAGRQVKMLVCRDDKQGRDGMERNGQKHHVMLAVARGIIQGAPNFHSEKSSDYQLVWCRILASILTQSLHTLETLSWSSVCRESLGRPSTHGKPG
jgi:hypothetical protein